MQKTKTFSYLLLLAMWNMGRYGCPPYVHKYWQIFMNPNGFGACVGRMYCLRADGD